MDLLSFFWIVCTAGLLAFLFYKGHKNTKQVDLKKIFVHHPDAPAAKAVRLRILHLSDMHLENISISPGQLYEKLQKEQVDLIALTGDFLDRKRTIPKLIPYLQVLNDLDSKYGIYAVLGNHDYVLRKKNLKYLEEVFAAHNCKVLHNESIAITVSGIKVNIVGIDDYSTGRSDLAKAFRGVKSGAVLVLTHDPNVVLQMKNYHFDYLLAGHFHGGQICYPKAYHLAKMGKLPRMNIIKGLHEYDHKLFYISEGLGQTGINVRYGSRPELSIHDWALASANSHFDSSAI